MTRVAELPRRGRLAFAWPRGAVRGGPGLRFLFLTGGIVARPALFLDRDGVINVDTGYVHTPEECVFIDGIFELTRQAREAGCPVVVVTNQAGIGRGYYTEAQFHAFMDWMRGEFRRHGSALDAVYYCPDHPVHGIGKYRRDTDMRKPGPGMFLQAARELDIDLAHSLMVGDSPTDMAAARAAGVGTLLHLGPGACPGATPVASLHEARAWLPGQRLGSV